MPSVELSTSITPTGLRRGKPIFGLAETPAGQEFTDMSGRDISFSAADIPIYARNTKAAIAAMMAKGMPGLPIDARKHDKGEAAGWIVDVIVGVVDGLRALVFETDWTELGANLISKRIMTNFSPTVDTQAKTVRGGSLTNWPATVSESKIPIFPAIELQEKKQEKKMEKENEAAPPLQLAELTGLSDEHRVELQKYAAGVLEMARKQALAEAQLAFAALKREHDFAEFAQKVTAGTPENPRILPIKAGRLTDFAAKLPAGLWADFQALITEIWEAGTVSTATAGHGQAIKSGNPLPAAIDAALKAGNLKLTDLTSPILNLGDLSNYDLSQYGGK